MIINAWLKCLFCDVSSDIIVCECELYFFDKQIEI